MSTSEVDSSQRRRGEESPLSRVAVALDTADWDEFERWCKVFGPRVGVLKVGLEAYVRWGGRAVETAQRSGAAIFLDLKLHDIPNTVAGAVSAARGLDVDYLTLHASGGSAMLAAATEASAGELHLLAVTVLTHLDGAALEELGFAADTGGLVERWAGIALGAGVSGLVCSPHELERLRARFAPPFLLVTPGLRGRSQAVGDQKRTAEPAAALRAGSDILVIGRPLTRAEDPAAALDALTVELSPTS